MEINKEDYEEPRCVICDPANGMPVKSSGISLERIARKLDEYLGAKDYAGAERHLKYWLSEAQSVNDKRSEFGIRNEMMGYYRKQGNEEAAILCANKSLELMEELQMDGTISAGTCYVNCGTVYDNFNKPESALTYFEKARHIYEAYLPASDGRLGGLYNNMGLAYAALRRFGEADSCFGKALDVMAQMKHGEPELAITYLNMADAVRAEHGQEKAEEKINRYLEKASQLLDAANVPDRGYYAYVCEKCATVYDYYGWFFYAGELRKRVEEIDREVKQDE